MSAIAFSEKPQSDAEHVLLMLLTFRERPQNNPEQMLADMQQEGPGVSDIFAGIGYILGLVGIAAYVQNRKKKA